MVGKAMITALKTSGETNIVQLNLMAETTHDDVELWQHFGFTSAPPKGSRALVVCVGGNTDHSVVVATENGSFRVKDLKSGESCLYDAKGSKIHLKDDGSIELVTKKMTEKIEESLMIDTPEMENTGTFKASEVSDSKGSLDQLRQYVNKHVHTSAPPGNPTSTPLPVNPIQ